MLTAQPEAQISRPKGWVLRVETVIGFHQDTLRAKWLDQAQRAENVHQASCPSPQFRRGGSQDRADLLEGRPLLRNDEEFHRAVRRVAPTSVGNLL